MEATLQPPDLIRPVVGWRSWGWNEQRCLTSLTMCGTWGSVGHYVWDKAHMHAECLSGSMGAMRMVEYGSHESPGSLCPCGLYAYHECPRSWTEWGPSQMRGLVLAWGQLVVHVGGFRAEHMQVIALSFPTLHSAARHSFGREVAARYGVPLVTLPELDAIAAEHNGRISKSQFQ